MVCTGQFTVRGAIASSVASRNGTNLRNQVASGDRNSMFCTVLEYLGGVNDSNFIGGVNDSNFMEVEVHEFRTNVKPRNRTATKT